MSQDFVPGARLDDRAVPLAGVRRVPVRARGASPHLQLAGPPARPHPAARQPHLRYIHRRQVRQAQAQGGQQAVGFVNSTIGVKLRNSNQGLLERRDHCSEGTDYAATVRCEKRCLLDRLNVGGTQCSGLSGPFLLTCLG